MSRKVVKPSTGSVEGPTEYCRDRRAHSRRARSFGLNRSRSRPADGGRIEGLGMNTRCSVPSGGRVSSAAKPLRLILSLLLIPSGAETAVFWAPQRQASLVAPTRRDDLKLSRGATAKLRENAVKQDHVQATNTIGITRQGQDFSRRGGMNRRDRAQRACANGPRRYGANWRRRARPSTVAGCAHEVADALAVRQNVAQWLPRLHVWTDDELRRAGGRCPPMEIGSCFVGRVAVARRHRVRIVCQPGEMPGRSPNHHGITVPAYSRASGLVFSGQPDKGASHVAW